MFGEAHNGYASTVTQSSVLPNDRPHPKPGPGTSVVVLTASLGGVQAVSDVLGGLPAEFPSAIVVNLHRAARPGRDHLPDVLAFRSTLPVRSLGMTNALEPGHVHVLPPGTALANIDDGFMAAQTLQEGWRTADPTMTSVAHRYGSGCIGVVLSGRLNDGAEGARSIKRAGGRVIVQDPADAVAHGMPAAALATGSVDLVVPLRRVAQALIALIMAPGGAALLRTPRAPWAS